MRGCRSIPAVLLAILFLIVWDLRKLPAGGASGDAFSVVVLPDTQIYAWKYPEIFEGENDVA